MRFSKWTPLMRPRRSWSIIASSGNLPFERGGYQPVRGPTIVESQPNGTAVGAIRVEASIDTYRYTTVLRRSAGQAGAGSMAYDTARGKRIRSDGTNWKDATGTVV